MQSNTKIRTIAAVAMGTLLGAGAREAAAWCPTSVDRTVSCSNCTVTLTCNVNGLGAIQITGYNATFDGDWYTISGSLSSAITVTSDYATVKNVNISDPAVSGVHVLSESGDYVRVENVYVTDGFAGFNHFYDGNYSVYNSWFISNQYGMASTYGSDGGYGDAISTTTAYNTSGGIHMNDKSYSYLSQNYSYGNSGHGVEVISSPTTLVQYGSYYDNTGSGKNGLRLVSSNNSSILDNYGVSNGGHDCTTVSSSSVYATGNSWGTYSGSCN